MNSKAKYYINKLKLIPHPEGGYYKEIYRSGEYISTEGLPKRYKSKRVFSTSIYFLLEGKQISRFHRLKSDEVWHFYDGSPVAVYILNNNIEKIILGK
ncbi:MAG: cupin domain-containing protein, partial [Ignavibacteriaceae bacterium]